MSLQPCSSRDILDVNRNKEYTLISTALLESVLTDTRLNAQSVKLWQLLFNQARYHPTLDIKISYSYLSKKLDKSTRTIARYVETLQNAGYLVVSHNFDKNGGQRPSTISVRVPQSLIDHAKNRKDRCYKNHSTNNGLLIESASSSIDSIENIGRSNRNDPAPVTENTDSPSMNVLRETVEDNASGTEVNLNEPEIFSIKEDTFIQDPNYINNSGDKNDRAWHDINVIQKDINKKDINKNNNSIVVSLFDNPTQNLEFNALQTQIYSMEKLLSEGTQEINSIKDHALMYSQIRKNAELEGSLHLARIALERLQKESKNKKDTLEVTNQLTSNPSFMMTKTGYRVISSFTFKRLVKLLKGYGYQGNALNSLINEIVFEVRFGSLINCNRTKNPLEMDNAVNIALKLVRENRWSRPVLLKTAAEGV